MALVVSMLCKFLKKRFFGFHKWWNSPITKKDRIKGAFIGAIGCLWIAGIGRVIFGEMPVSISVVGVWALCGSMVGLTLGILFPKTVSVFCFPFSVFGISN